MENLVLDLAAVLTLVAIVAAVLWARGHAPSERLFRYAYHGMTGCLLLASALLMTAILRHDFRFEYVIAYSSRDLPLLYLFSSFWAGQQGTYLLWALFGALLGYPLLRRGAWEPATVMAYWVPTIGFMQLLMLDPGGNPFRLAARVPPDGNGLNPLLQDPWMASHPPMVFLGYVAMTVPAVLALAALTRRAADRWLASALRWSLLAFVLLGAGIVLGGFWAYKVLGWGGYWGWDPVENASLVPWIVVTALIHGLLVQKATGALPRTNLVLALAGYALVFYATFLTRSGVLADFSVHSFPGGTIFRWLLAIQILIVGVSALALLRSRTIAAREVSIEFAWPVVLIGAVCLLGLSAGMVLVGTSWPILSSWAGKASSFGPSWYNGVSLPLYVTLLALLGVAPYLAWTTRPWASLRRRLLPSVAVAVTGCVIAVAAGARGASALPLLFAALAALAANLFRLVEVGRFRLLGTGAALAHTGFALMFVGIVASSFWDSGQDAGLPLGRPVEVLGRTMTFLGHVDGSEPHDRWRIEIVEPGRPPRIADVQMFRTGKPPRESTMHRPAILRGLTSDLYVAPTGLEAPAAGSGLLRLTVEVSRKPLIGLLWIGTILLGLGCGVAWLRHASESRVVRVSGSPSIKARAA